MSDAGNALHERSAGLRGLGFLRSAKVVLFVFTIVIAYVAGRGGRDVAERRADAMQTEIELLQAHRYLGLAAFEASRSNFANASAATTRFYDALTALQSQDLPLADHSRDVLAAIAGQREVITAQIARASPEAARTLAEAYVAMNSVIQEQRLDRDADLPET